MFDLSSVYFHDTLQTWVDLIHKSLSARYEMRPIKIKPHDFGYDSYASILNAVLSNVSIQDIVSAIKDGPDMNKFVPLAHDAWITNYIQWKAVIGDSVSNNPKKTLNTNARNDRATTMSDNLTSNDLELYHDIITNVFDVLTRKLLEEGIKNMSIN